jgi:type IV secretion system protein VirB1
MKVAAIILLAQAALMGQRLTPAEFAALTKRCIPGFPLNTVHAIARVESAFYPLALSVNYPDHAGVQLARQPANLREALAWTQWLHARGYTVSIGLMQVNSEHLKTLRLTAEQAFDPCLNLQAVWLIFSSHYERAAKTFGSSSPAAFHAALSGYNSGSLTAGYTNGYVEKVLAAIATENQPKRPLNPETFSNLNVTPQSKQSDNTENDPNEAPTRVSWPGENKVNGEGSKNH